MGLQEIRWAAAVQQTVEPLGEQIAPEMAQLFPRLTGRWMSQWPHEKIRSVAVRYIKESATKESEWRFTCLDALPERLGRVVRLEESERAIVSCFIDGQRWCAMTTSRVFGVFHGSQFSCSPLDVRQWRWGDFKHDGRSEAEVATLALANGTHLRIPYETGPAAMGPIYYERFWTVKYPALQACPNVFREESAGCCPELILGWSEFAKALFPTGFSRTG
jgi:hypothetical protein